MSASACRPPIAIAFTLTPGVGCTGVDESGVDQCVTNGNHAYMGVPHSNMAFEFNTDCIDDHALFPSICFCDPWNNNIHYGKVTGSSC